MGKTCRRAAIFATWSLATSTSTRGDGGRAERPAAATISKTPKNPWRELNADVARRRVLRVDSYGTRHAPESVCRQVPYEVMSEVFYSIRLSVVPGAVLRMSRPPSPCVDGSPPAAGTRGTRRYLATLSDQRERIFMSARERVPGVRRRTRLSALRVASRRPVCLQRPRDFARCRLRLL